MKKKTYRAISLFMSFVMLLGIATIPMVVNASVPSVQLTISSATGAVGSTVDIALNITANSGGCSGNFNVAFDNTKLQFVSGANGTVITSTTGASGSVNPTVTVVGTVSKIGTGFTSDANPLTLAGSLFTFKFTVLAGLTGETTISVSSPAGAELQDTNFDPIPCQLNSGKVSLPAATSTISFNTAGGLPAVIAPITQDEGTAVTRPANPAKEGFTFEGWVPDVPATMPVDDVTCVAQWKAVAPTTSTITWSTGGGLWNSGGSADKTTVVNNGVLPTAPDTVSKNGNAFAGWTPSIVAAAGAATYTATWTLNSYSVWYYIDNQNLFWSNSGLEPLHVGDRTPTPPTVPTREGYIFAGWSPAVPEFYVTSFNSTFATWTKIPNPTSTITFDLAGGIPAIADITQDEGTAVTAPADPTKAGFTFDGWLPAVPGTMPVDNVTCVAQWKAVPVMSTITFNTDGGTAVADITGEDGTAVPSVTKSKEGGVKFDGRITAIPARYPREVLASTARAEALPVMSTKTFKKAAGT
ncbi:MAG: InlB B-repeat-containing protein, partial [Eubacteriales bacterium]